MNYPKPAQYRLKTAGGRGPRPAYQACFSQVQRKVDLNTGWMISTSRLGCSSGLQKNTTLRGKILCTHPKLCRGFVHGRSEPCCSKELQFELKGFIENAEGLCQCRSFANHLVVSISLNFSSLATFPRNYRVRSRMPEKYTVDSDN